MGTVNLATKYSPTIAKRFTVGSYIAGKCSTEWDFSGVRTIKVYTPQTVEPVDYTRSGTNRYGTPVEMEDIVQEMYMSQDKGYSITIDKGNNADQEMIKNATKMLKLQQDERVIPMVDKYAFKRFANMAGKVAGITKPTKTTIVDAVSAARRYFTNHLVPDKDRYLYISAEMNELLSNSDAYTKLEGTGVKALEKGVVGKCKSFTVVEVPDTYLPADVYFIAQYKNATVVPYKIKDAKVHEDVAGISGALLEGRDYFDAFVVGTRADGVYVAAASSAVIADPTISISGNSATITSSGNTIKYTTDGTDPRYSDTAEVYTAAVSLTSGQTIKAYAYNAAKLPSGVASSTNS